MNGDTKSFIVGTLFGSVVSLVSLFLGWWIT